MVSSGVLSARALQPLKELKEELLFVRFLMVLTDLEEEQKEEMGLADLCLQTLFYFSNQNLATDLFFRTEMAENDGWLSIDVLLRCNRIQKMGACKNDILLSLVGSDLEIAPDGSAVRRPHSAPLPRLTKGVVPRRQPQRDVKQTSQGVYAATVAWQSNGHSHTNFHAPALSSHSNDHSLWNDCAEPINSQQSVCSDTLLTWAKARHKSGCREVQDALRNGNNETCVAIASGLRGHVWEAVESPNANHVLQECIVNMSPHALQFVLDELMFENGAATRLAKHEYGCRVFLRILEHLRTDQVQEMVNEVLMNVGTLARDSYGNYVLQGICEHGTQDMQRQLVQSLLERMPRLVTDHRAAAVIAKALKHAPEEEKQFIAQALLQVPGQLVQMAKQRFGQAVAEAVLELPSREGAEAQQVLRRGENVLTKSRHGRAVLNKLKPDGADQPHRLPANGGA